MLVQYDKQCADKKFLKETQAAEALLEEEQKKKEEEEEEEEEQKVNEGKEEELWIVSERQRYLIHMIYTIY